MNFSVSAVWNGKEALEYILKATSPDLTTEQSEQYPVPSLVLMDVQMPILDGYHATHLLRHHAPFTTIKAIGEIPIIAMTASAIQGDREKCERAGMDDYMAKPVKRSILEKTILKWITSGRSVGESSAKPTIERSSSIGQSSTCTGHDMLAAEFVTHAPGFTSASVAERQNQPLPGAPSNESIRRSSLSKSILASSALGGDTEGDRVMGRVEAEEKARSLRDAKLINATETSGQAGTIPTIRFDGSLPSETPQSPLIMDLRSLNLPGVETPHMALTEENISRFNKTFGDGGPAPGILSPNVSSNEALHTLSDIPGPPPEVGIAATSIEGVEANAEALVESLLNVAQFQARSGSSSPNNLDSPAKSGRGQVGALSASNRQKSDWSSSTARPEKHE